MTKLLLLAGSWLSPLPCVHWPFSMSASTHGPLPLHGDPSLLLGQYWVRLTASMCPTPLSVLRFVEVPKSLVSALPKSKQQPVLTCVPEATMYMPSGAPCVATPVAPALFGPSSRYPTPGSMSSP